jgi:hypothetical protein
VAPLDEREWFLVNVVLSRLIGCGFAAKSRAMLSARMVFIGCIVLETVDMDENRECEAECKDDVKEDRLLLLSENLWWGDRGVSTCESS